MLLCVYILLYRNSYIHPLIVANFMLFKVVFGQPFLSGKFL